MSATTPLPLSVLDLSPVPRGGTAARALADTIDLAGVAENLGYHRYWLAEHHLNPGVASASPAVLIALVASATRHIRVGSGAVQISHLTPLLVAEQFGTIAQVHPDRIDLGLGHLDFGALQRRRTATAEGTLPSGRVVDGLLVPAPARLGGSTATFELLARLLGHRPGDESQSYQDQVRDLLAFLDGEYRDSAGRAVHAVPAEGADLQVWVLGSSGGVSAQTAGAAGLPFAAGYHTAPAGVLDAVAAYRSAFMPSVSSPRPYVMVSADVVVAETDAEARRLAAPFASWVLDIRTGRGAQPYPTPDAAERRRWTAEERALVQDRVDTQIVGSPDTVVERLRTLARVTGADELLITTITSEHADRVRSYELLAQAWQASGVLGDSGADSTPAHTTSEVESVVSDKGVAARIAERSKGASGGPQPRPRLAVELDGAGRHPAAWRLADAEPDRLLTAGWFVDLVRRAEEGGLDFVAITDAFTPYSNQPGRIAGRLDAVAIAARVAPATSVIGLVPTATVTHTEPFHLSKALATLDFVSLGRAGWEVEVSRTQAEADLFGRKDAAAARVLWAEASDAVEVVVRLWDSWDDDAEIRDVATGRFIDRDRLHYVDFEGEFFSVRGPSITPRPPQGHPLIVVGVRDLEAIGTAATHADVVRVSAPDLVSAQTARQRIRAEVAEAGRDPDEVSILLDLEVLVAADRDAAQAVLGELDEWAGAAVPARSLRVVGSPGEVADLVERGLRAGAFDGVVFAPLALPSGVTSLVEEVLPLLVDRGLAETAAERANTTGRPGLRARLGLPVRAASRFAVAEVPVSAAAPIEKKAVVGADDRQKEHTR